MLEISVILPTRNRAHLLPFVLDALKRQTLPQSQFEIIAIDDGSNDKTFEVLNRERSDLPLKIFHQRHAGLAAAKNLGIFASRGRILLFLDDDDVAAPDLLSTHVAAHGVHHEEEIAILGYTGLAPEVAQIPLMQHVTQVGCQLFSYGWMKAGMVLDYTAFWGGRSSCKRNLLLLRGIFNPAFAFGYEDIELGWRLAKDKFRVVYEPAAVSTMIRTLTFREFCARQQRQGRSQTTFANLHAGPEIRKYCEIDDGLRLWKRNVGQFTQYIRWVEQLDRMATIRMKADCPLGPRDQGTLDDAYRAAFTLCRAKGIALNATDSIAPMQTSRDGSPNDRELQPLINHDNVTITPESGRNGSQESKASPRIAELDSHRNATTLAVVDAGYQRDGEQIVTPPSAARGSVIFQEATPGHEFLFDTFAELKDVRLLKRQLNPWVIWEDQKGIKKLFDFLDFGLQTAREHRSKIFFLTLDYWFSELVAKEFKKRLSASGLEAYAFLHRYPIHPAWIERLQHIAPALKKVLVFSPDMKRDLESNLGLTNVEYVPLPAMTENLPARDRAAVRTRLSISDDHVVISMLGEARLGKGYDLALAALAQLDPIVKQKAFFLFGGKASHELRKAVLDCLKDNGLMGFVDLRLVSDKREYITLTDLEFSDYIQASDIGLLIYREDQRLGMSGILPNYIMAGKPVIATADSYPGKLVSKHGLGWLLSEESPAALAKLITEAVASYDRAPLSNVASYKPEIEKKEVLARIKEILWHIDAPPKFDSGQTRDVGSHTPQSKNDLMPKAIAELSPPKATVVICTYNRYQYLTSLLPKLERQNVNFVYEILIVDNSDDEAAKAKFYGATSLPGTARVIPSFPPGLSRARNAGLQAAKAQYVVFIDDDTEPEPDWLQEIVNVFEKHKDAAVVGGPISPIWPMARPSWIPPEYQDALAILDLGSQDKRMEHGYVYGANISFRVNALRAIGGFREHLGRQGNIKLLSNEELQVQDELRKQGYAIYYAAKARLSHHVHKERINRGWFRRRMTWQAVSDALTMDEISDIRRGWPGLDFVIAAADRIGIDRSFLNCLTDSDNAHVTQAQLEFLRGLTTLALTSNANISANDLAQLTQAANVEVKGTAPSAVVGRSADRQIAPALNLAQGGVVFFEATPGHEFLFDTFSDLKNARLLKRRIDPWAEDEDGIGRLFEFLEAGLQAARETSATMCFLTLDYWQRPYLPIGEVVARGFKQRVSDFGVPAFAFLHRYFNDPGGIQRLQHIAPALKKVLVFSPDMKRDLESNLGLTNVEYVPLPAMVENFPADDRSAIRARLAIPNDRVVVSMLGEARRGKGYDLVLEALARLDPVTKQKAFFLFGGKASAELRKAVQDCLSDNGLQGLADLRVLSDARQYAVLTDFEFSDYIQASDVGLLIYREDQRFGMSGVLPNYAVSGKPVILTADSYAGKLMSGNPLGWLLSTESPAALAKLIIEAVASFGKAPLTDAMTRYKLEFEKRSVLARMTDILERQ